MIVMHKLKKKEIYKKVIFIQLKDINYLVNMLFMHVDQIGKVEKKKKKKFWKNLLKKFLKKQKKKGAKTISIPGISTGVLGFPKDKCAEILFDAAEEHFEDEEEETSLEEIRFVNFDETTVDVFKSEFKKRYGGEDSDSDSEKKKKEGKKR